MKRKPLFTKAESLEIWNRLKSGKSCAMDRNLAHVMDVSGGNLKNINQHAKALYNPTLAAYRLVWRGLIRTTPQFDRIAKQLLTPNQKETE